MRTSGGSLTQHLILAVGVAITLTLSSGRISILTSAAGLILFLLCLALVPGGTLVGNSVSSFFFRAIMLASTFTLLILFPVSSWLDITDDPAQVFLFILGLYLLGSICSIGIRKYG